MTRFRTMIELLLLSSFFLLPFARLKLTLAGLPIYALELPIMIAGIIFLSVLIRDRKLPHIPLFSDRPLAAGIILFALGAAISSAMNPFSLSGLGLLKSWIFFPIAGSALWSAARGRSERLFAAWLISAAGIASAALLLPPESSLTYDGRLAAWYASPNFLAIAVAPGILIGAHFVLSLLAAKRSCPARVILAALAVSISSVALFLTHSYGAWAGTALALAALFGSAASRKQRAMLFVLLAAAASVFMLSEYGSEKWHSLTSFDERSSLSSRIMIWRSAAMMIADHPFSGIGIGRFQEVYLDYQRFFPPYLEWAVPEPHSLPLALWLNTGLIGLIGFALIIGRAAWLIVGRSAPESAKASSRLALSLLMLFIGYGIFDTPYFGNDLSFLFFILIAASLSLGKTTDRSDTAASSGDR